MLTALLIVLAQGTSSGIVANARNVVQKTSAAINLWVDGNAGSDSNSCTSNDAGACLTLGGALSKLSKYTYICDAVTINMAGEPDGGYHTFTGLDKIVGFRQCVRDGGTPNSSQGPRILIAGPPPSQWAPYYVDAGTNSGTVSSVTASGLNNAYTINANGQVWVDGGLKGLFFVDTTTNTAAPIIDNTAATLRLTGSTSSATNDTYIIGVPAAHIASSAATASLRVVGNQVPVNFQDIGFTGFQGWPSIGGEPTDETSLTRVWFFNNQAASPVLLISSHNALTLSGVSLVSARNQLLSTSGTLNTFNVSNLYALGQVNSGYTINYGHSGHGTCLGVVAEETSTSGTALQFSPTTSYTLGCSGSPRLICPSGNAGTTGVFAGGNSGNLPSLGRVNMTIDNIYSEGCGNSLILTGADARMSMSSTTGTVIIVGATKGFVIGKGSHAYLTSGTSFTWTGVTNQLVLDGANHPLTDLTGAGALSNTTFLSAFYE